MTLLAYLLKVIVVSAILYGYYRLFLRNKRFHHYNRFFLLSALLLSTVLPFIRIPLLYEPENPVHVAMYRTVSVINADYGDEVVNVQAVAPVNESVFTLMNIIYLMYAIGVLFLMTLVTKSLLYIRSLRRRYAAEKITSLRFYNTHEPGTPFSFFRSIFWNNQLSIKSEEGQQIFRHELFHVQHQHSADRLLSEILTAIFWFNPFFHLIKKELKAIHEFLADQFAISGSDRYAYATLLVQQALDSGRHAVTNHFFQNHIKRRIAMITQFQQSKYGYWSRVMVLPLSLILFCFVTLYAKKPDNLPAKILAATNIEKPVEQVKDTVPGRLSKEKELQLKKRQIELEALKKRMVEQEEEIRQSHSVELEQLKKQMVEMEVLTREREAERKMRQKDGLRLKEEMLRQQGKMEEMAKEREEKMREIIKEHETKMRENPKYREEGQARLEQMKKEIIAMERDMRERQRQEMDAMRDKLRELESRSEHEVERKNERDVELDAIRIKIREREREIKNHQREEIQRFKKEIDKQQQEIRRQDEERREQQEKAREQHKEQKDKQGSLFNRPGKLFRTDDSLLMSVIRYYHRNIRYPDAAIQNSAEGPVYFSITVDRNGMFKDFVLYDRAPEGKKITNIVTVTEKMPMTVVERELNSSEKSEILRKEVQRTTHGRQKDLAAHPDDKQYFFKAQFQIIKPKTDNKFLIKNTSEWQVKGNDWQDDTIPARKAKPGKPAQPGEKLGPRPTSEPKPAPGAKPGPGAKPVKELSRKAKLGKKTEKKIFATKKPVKPIGATKPVEKLKKKGNPKNDGSGQVSEQEEYEEEYSYISVTGEK